ncbi:MAG: hypothetical protein LBS91_03025 [Clostridiales Family XIII bacterium]|jgi:hypothetical protein|nr:hypothetical protein [Clostridiales Family XIII bacterium]
MGKTVKEYTKAGPVIFVRVFSQRLRRREEGRGPRSRPSSRAVRELNDQRAARAGAILINHNFSDADFYLTLTYQGEAPGALEARAQIDKFLRSLRDLYGRLGLPLKWVAATEYENKRIHHHLVISGGAGREQVAALWPHGFTRSARLYTHGDYRPLAAYLIKETSKTFREPGAACRQRLRHSRNCAMPETRVERVKREEIGEPKIPKGYAIEAGSDYTCENPTTGEQIRSYILVPLIEGASFGRLKRLPRGKPKSDGAAKWLRDNEEYQYTMPIDREGDY